MSINIDKEDLREAIDLLNLVRSQPLESYLGTATMAYDGEWLTITGVGGQYPAIGTGHGAPSYGATRSDQYLKVEATIKAPGDDTSIYFFFLEPRKALYDYFQGFQHDGANHVMTFRRDASEEEDIIAGQDWTVEHTFKIAHLSSFDYNSGSVAAGGTPHTITHGLWGTPTCVTPTPQADAGDVWVDTVGAATFNINWDGGGNVAFYWQAIYQQAPDVQGFIDGVLKAQCTDVNDISLQPFCVYACEPNGNVRTISLKYPPGITMCG